MITATANALPGDRERFLAAGMNDYLSKPIENEELRRVLTRWLRVVPGRLELDLDDADDEAEPQAAPLRPLLPTALPGLEIHSGPRRAGGNEAPYRRLLLTFARDVGAARSRLQTLLTTSQTSEATDLLHNLKGTAATVGARPVAAAAASLESALRESSASIPSLDELGASIEELLRGCSTLRDSEPVPSDRAPALGTAAAKDALPVVRQLAEHVANSNLAAKRCFAEPRALLGERLGSPGTELEACLDRLDFEGAAARLATITQAAREP